jgi:hypothetical protein
MGLTDDEDGGSWHWFRDCTTCGAEFLTPTCPHSLTPVDCPNGHATIGSGECDCYDNRELLEYPCNCDTCKYGPWD